VRSRIVESRIVGSEHCYKSLSFCSPFSAYGNGEITLDGKENRKKHFFSSLNLRSHSKRKGGEGMKAYMTFIREAFMTFRECWKVQL